MDTYRPEIFNEIADILLESKKLMEIERWDQFELDLSTPFDKANDVYKQIKDKIGNDTTGVYAIFNEKQCLYIGKGMRVWQRVKDHYKAAHLKPVNDHVRAIRWIRFFSKHRGMVKVYWKKYRYLENKTLDNKLRELYEHILQVKYRPAFEQFS